MRVNVYAEEMTDLTEIISKEIDGDIFTGVRFYLQLPATVNGQQYQGPFMHRPGDDDSSAVTFWGKRDLRIVLRKALVQLDKHYNDAPSEQVTRNADLRLQWSEHQSPNIECSYDHIYAQTPFGRILITWKSWKDDCYLMINEHPFADAKGEFAGSTIEEARQTAEKFYFDAIKSAMGVTS